MKPCLVCHTLNPDDAVTCSACGEGSFGAADATEGDDHGKADGKKPKGNKGKRSQLDATEGDDHGKADAE